MGFDDPTIQAQLIAAECLVYKVDGHQAAPVNLQIIRPPVQISGHEFNLPKVILAKPLSESVSAESMLALVLDIFHGLEFLRESRNRLTASIAPKSDAECSGAERRFLADILRYFAGEIGGWLKVVDQLAQRISRELNCGDHISSIVEHVYGVSFTFQTSSAADVEALVDNFVKNIPAYGEFILHFIGIPGYVSALRLNVDVDGNYLIYVTVSENAGSEGEDSALRMVQLITQSHPNVQLDTQQTIQEYLGKRK